MIEAQFDPKKHKDWLGLAAELQTQGIRFDWSSGAPIASPPYACAYDSRVGVFRVVQPTRA